MKTTKTLLITIMVALTLLLASLTLIQNQTPSSYAAPPPAPTPIANLVNVDSWVYVPISSSVSFGADRNTSSRQLPGYSYLDLHITLDQGATPGGHNTTTLTIQFSNDDENWDDGPAILSSNTADVTEITRVPIFGRYVRFKWDVTNTNNITVTHFSGVAKK